MHIKDYLLSKNITKAEFARWLGITPQAMGRYVDGTRIPTREIMLAIENLTEKAVTYYDFPPKSAPHKPHADANVNQIINIS